MEPDPKLVETLARRLARLDCYKDIDLEVTTETVEIILALVRKYEDENWPRCLEEAARILDPPCAPSSLSDLFAVIVGDDLAKEQ